MFHVPIWSLLCKKIKATKFLLHGVINVYSGCKLHFELVLWSSSLDETRLGETDCYVVENRIFDYFLLIR